MGPTSGNQQQQHESLIKLNQSTFDRNALSDRRWDWAGTGISALCTVKCIGLPFITSALPSLTALEGLSHNPWAHWAFAAAATPGAVQLGKWADKNRSIAGALAVSSGVSLMYFGAIGHTVAHMGSGHDHNSMEGMSMSHDHMQMGSGSNEMHDHSQHHMESTTNPPAAIVYGQENPLDALMGFSHWGFLFGGLCLGAGHLRRLVDGYKKHKAS